MELKSILATDCGSTTTKAILIQKIDGEYRLTYRGEAPTTVEAPFEDVTRGVLNAVMEIEELAERKILDGDEIMSPQKNGEGVDIYISTSSAGGGLQMMVAGVVKSMSGESAERAALGAGSIVMDVMASNDGRLPHEKIKRIRDLRPDMILLSGGIDGGTVSHVVELAEILHAANPQPRLGQNYKLPVIYAGNKNAQDQIRTTLGDMVDLDITENIRPVLERENLEPSRDKIHDLFMEHVMQQAPGYKKLMSWTDAPIMPTPGAVGSLIEMIAEKEKITVVGVDIGGATTDIFSVFEGKFNRTVSANLGMSYSICNVLAEAGLDNVLRWVPFDIDRKELTNRIGNKMIRPTTVPQSLEELFLEQAIAREALRLSFIQHKEFATSLKGVQKERTISDAFDQTSSGESLVNMMDLDLLVGSGGVLSHAPRREQSARMLIDAFMPEGITQLAVDSIFMMPQLGVLANIEKEDLAEEARTAALEVFHKDCLIRLGTCIAPVGKAKDGATVLAAEFAMPDGSTIHHNLKKNELYRIEAPYEPIQAKLTPDKKMNIGAGKGEPIDTTVYGGVVGLILDGRDRPITIPNDSESRLAALKSWSEAVNEYPNTNS
ncbi:MAG: methylaspartate mutase [Candidatus Marinimicrobia bacterium]|nr:methylaspartate mutase [Candidatus Neomarinimicrobiota bacterium]MBT6796237.1 methylaspartate mutase [Candidatus Neomarinimicrobiota bacterium]MBT6866042.1 methylaspartate mutase [Candidatus Neomarinimicrobiota bacterium]MBT7043264.1 methylaspartate mutase [Candidatus Neomarinimicrobiota bacterium]MBT7945657.1 methylaspartate mutase [Candidatus Neomarinimicrobiota bacterium]